MKKVLCFIDGLHQGGAERQLIGLTYLFQCKGYSVELLSYNGEGFYSKYLKEVNIKHITLSLKGGRWSKFWAIKNYLKKNKKKYDVIIAYKDSPNVIACLLKIFIRDFKLIVSERNTTQKITRSSKIKFFLYRFADAIVPNSYSQKNFIITNYPNLEKKINVITNFTDTDYFCPVEKKENDKLKIITAARISRQKNLINYLKAIKLLKERQLNVHFDWFGTIQTRQEDYGEEVMKFYHENKLEDIICFHDATPNILEKYQNSDVFCLPSSYEGFPNVVCEAMSCGLPILCSNVCDNPNIVKEGDNGFLFNPHEPEHIADCIESFFKMECAKRIEIGKKNRQKALELFSMAKFLTNYENLILKLIKE